MSKELEKRMELLNKTLKLPEKEILAFLLGSFIGTLTAKEAIALIKEVDQTLEELEIK